MIQRSDKDLLTLDSKPAMIGGRYRVKLVKVERGKAVIQVTDMQQPPPLVSPGSGLLWRGPGQPEAAGGLTGDA